MTNGGDKFVDKYRYYYSHDSHFPGGFSQDACVDREDGVL